jgi:hypothetical protein
MNVPPDISSGTMDNSQLLYMKKSDTKLKKPKAGTAGAACLQAASGPFPLLRITSQFGV